MIIKYRSPYYRIIVLSKGGKTIDLLQKINKLIDIERIVEITKDLINLRSDLEGNMEYEISIYLKSFLEGIGAKVKMQYVELKRYNIIARFPGKSYGKTLMYCGHIDVVPPGKEGDWKNPPFKAYLENNNLYGRGSTDMKGSIASFLHTMEIFHKLDIKLNGDILVVLDVDEEISNKGLYRFFESGITADACIVGEPTNMQIALGHRGVLGFKVKFKGKKSHASQPQLGINPIMHAMVFSQKVEKFIESKLKYRISPMGNSTMTITYIKAGKELNSIPNECELLIDRRLIIGESKDSCIDELNDILKEMKLEIDELDYEFQVTTYCEPGEVSPVNTLVKDMKCAINPSNPNLVPFTYLKATCEASLISKHMNIPVIICGPGNMEQAHIVNEYIEIEQLELGSRIYARFLIKYFS